ncbi:hypothetical protein BDZ97DRAFT_1770354 [Flammula alnicola]|nr:hypothetical protein BDZ97DRAFT_1770354 [Flammula alnicola]
MARNNPPIFDVQWGRVMDVDLLFEMNSRWREEVVRKSGSSPRINDDASSFVKELVKYHSASPIVVVSDVPARAWPESPGFGSALGGSGLVKSRARPKAGNQAWPGPALAQAGALLTN